MPEGRSEAANGPASEGGPKTSGRAPTAWVTGATGAWGGAFARALFEAGFDVVALCRRHPTELAEAAASGGRRLAFVPLDLVEPLGSLDGIRAELPPGFDPVPDVLVHAAVAVDGDRATLARIDYLGPADLLESVARAMEDRRSGRIGVLVPQNARLGLRGIGDISAPQGALWTWAEALRTELASRSTGVSLTLVIPPRTASRTQRHLAEATGHAPKVRPPDARQLLRAVLAGRRQAGRRPLLAAVALLFR